MQWTALATNHKRIEYKLCLFVRNCLAGTAPHYLIDFCQLSNWIQSHRKFETSVQLSMTIYLFHFFTQSTVAAVFLSLDHNSGIHCLLMCENICMINMLFEFKTVQKTAEDIFFWVALSSASEIFSLHRRNMNSLYYCWNASWHESTEALHLVHLDHSCQNCLLYLGTSWPTGWAGSLWSLWSFVFTFFP